MRIATTPSILAGAIEKLQPEMGSMTDIAVYLAGLMLLANAALLFHGLTRPARRGFSKRTIAGLGIAELSVVILVTLFLAFFYGGETVANIQAVDIGEEPDHTVKGNLFLFLPLQLTAFVLWLICYLVVSGKSSKTVGSTT